MIESNYFYFILVSFNKRIQCFEIFYFIVLFTKLDRLLFIEAILKKKDGPTIKFKK